MNASNITDIRDNAIASPSLVWAQHYAAQGLPVFSLPPRSKIPPKGGNGFKDSTLDLAAIAAWAPGCNVGINPPPGIVVVDVDPQHDGDKQLAALEAQYSPLPPTRTAVTGNGGSHRYYRVPAELTWPSKLLGQRGIDIKTSTGYLVAPPSVHPNGKPYHWIDPAAPIADAPQWLIDQGFTAGERSAARVVVEEDERTQPDDVLDKIVAAVEPYYLEGRRTDMAKYLGGWCKRREWSPSDAAYIIERLPSKTAAGLNRAVNAARAAWKYNTDGFGWEALKGMLGPDALAVLDAAPNPKWQREQAGLASASRDILATLPANAVSAANAYAVPAPGNDGLPVPAPPTPHTVPLVTLHTAGDVKAELRARLERTRNQGPQRPTGLPPLDKALRGGMRDEKVMIVGGAPGAGKTALLRQVADFMCRLRVAVGWLAGDEEPSAIDARRLQAIGVTREIAEQLDAATIELAMDKLGHLPFVIYDAGEGWTIERVFADLATRYPDMPRAFFGDSVQTIRTERTATIESERKKIDDVMTTVKLLARAPATKAFALLTSELARGSYRSEASAEATSDLAAFKESGGIEYYGHILLVLRSVKGDGSYIEVAMPKNRLGPKIDFTLKIDFETTNLKESFDDPKAAALEAQARGVIPEIRQLLESAGWPGMSQKAIETAVGGTSAIRAAVRAALPLMLKEKIATYQPGKHGAHLWKLVPNGVTAPAGSYAPPPIESEEGEGEAVDK